ncbi:MXAN_0125 family MYXO-CTERM protein [Polyangium sorediatum]|uniref:MYXO-CTERM sorting domain-containing protein n=1 Tax=Polyangium sorediatum TaxID=889274 RepID=A0ABT6P544_9BACT|nr:MXAN_0125 family MYXO-CTERM protein [Polyangium sorediatum]MDI1435732.1 MYXO-CTERM sorting domain-containing protein [Polyangium sorediatum]
MKLLALAIPFAVALTLAPRAAHAGCPQAGDGCDAVIKIEARLEGAPACAVLDTVEPENGCVCYGTVNLVNNCAFEVAAQDFSFVSDKTLVLAGETGILNVEGSPSGEDVGGGPGVHHDELNLQGDGQSFKLVLDYTVERRVLETGGCSVSGAERPGLAAVGLGLAALLFARRRRGR